MEFLKSFKLLDEYISWRRQDNPVFRRDFHRAVLRQWKEAGTDSFHMSAWCDACNCQSTFLIDMLYANSNVKGEIEPNWRERVVCSKCRLNCRLRASLSIILGELTRTSKIWLAEQVTPLHKYLVARFDNVIGSEFIGPEMVSGQLSSGGIRHEDCTQSSFENGELDGVLSFDVLEHVPNYEAAIHEAFRILRVGGTFIWSAPFDRNTWQTSVRARVLSDGRIVHIDKPIFHGDPMNHSAGILCFQIFGWDVTKLMRDAGFSTVEVRLIWSDKRGIIGEPQPFFVAKK
jgi:Methyltransferase domain